MRRNDVRPFEVFVAVRTSLIDAAPTRFEEIDRFFAANDSLLLLITNRLFRTHAPANLLEEVQADIIATAVPEAREKLVSWFAKNQALLSLIARRMASALRPKRAQQPSPKALS